MTTTINASTSSGLVNTADTSGVLQLQTANTAAVTIDASQNVGIGTTTPDIFSRGYGRTVGINDSGSGGAVLQINSASSYPAIELGRGGVRKFVLDAQSTVCEINSLEAVPMTFGTNSTERMRINAGAPILCLSGGNTSATGTGIAFPATQSASSDANTLDDYEEGTWTPNVGGNATYNYQVGIYVKVGRLVFASFDIQISIIGTGSTATLSGFPFTSTGAGFPYSGSTSYWASLTTNLVYLGFYMQNASTTALFVGNSGTAGTTIQYNSFGVFGSGSRICGTIVYESAS